MSKPKRKFFNPYTNNPYGLAFTLFPILILLVFMFFPIFYSLFLSFTNADIQTLRNLGNFQFVGFRNFQKMLFDDPIFWKSVGNTFYFVLVCGPLTVAVSLLTALLLNLAFIKAKGFFRSIYFLPVVTTIVAVAVVWRFLYEPHFGLINQALALLSLQGPNWLSDPLTAMPAIIIMATWKSFGVNMVILIAGLQGIPREQYEAAQIDGAGPVQQFWYITIPWLKPVLLIVVVMVTIGYLQLFAEPFIMTQGGPLNSTISMTMLVYNNGFRFFNLGYASAMAYFIFALIAVLSFVQFRFLRSEK